MQEVEIVGLRCLVREPDGFRKDQKWPVLLVLNGAGSRGEDMNVVRKGSFFTLAVKNGAENFLLVSPLCTKNTWFDLWEHLLALVKELAALPYADPDRLYVLGGSMGGYATWQLAMSLPEAIAAIVPICGGGMYWNAERLVNVPVWDFHGAKDTVVLPEESVKMVEKVNRRGGTAKLTLYPDNGHDAWTDTYSNPEVFAWLLAQKKKRGDRRDDGYGDPKKFG